MKEYEDYVMGKDLTHRLQLYYPIGKNKKVSVEDMNKFMGDHFEGTILDPTMVSLFLLNFLIIFNLKRIFLLKLFAFHPYFFIFFFIFYYDIV
jgi:hypothetical protein